MVRFLAFMIVLLTPGAGQAQRNEVWNNPDLSQRGMQYGEQQVILRQDLAHCHGRAFEKSRAALPPEPPGSLSQGAHESERERKRKALAVELFNRCMAEKGWFAREAKPQKPAPKAPRETAT
jgi:hypothetical protein